jgi:hypothetical protein
MFEARESITDGFILRCNICGEEIKFNKEYPIKDYRWNNITAYTPMETEICEIECKCGNKARIE